MRRNSTLSLFGSDLTAAPTTLLWNYDYFDDTSGDNPAYFTINAHGLPGFLRGTSGTIRAGFEYTTFVTADYKASGFDIDYLFCPTGYYCSSDPVFDSRSGNDVIATAVIQTGNDITPLPAALPLFAAGLGVMGLFGWRRKRKSAAATPWRKKTRYA
jgi:hypothetical protein